MQLKIKLGKLHRLLLVLFRSDENSNRTKIQFVMLKKPPVYDIFVHSSDQCLNNTTTTAEGISIFIDAFIVLKEVVHRQKTLPLFVKKIHKNSKVCALSGKVVQKWTKLGKTVIPLEAITTFGEKIIERGLACCCGIPGSTH